MSINNIFNLKTYCLTVVCLLYFNITSSQNIITKGGLKGTLVTLHANDNSQNAYLHYRTLNDFANVTLVLSKNDLSLVDSIYWYSPGSVGNYTADFLIPESSLGTLLLSSYSVNYSIRFHILRKNGNSFDTLRYSNNQNEQIRNAFVWNNRLYLRLDQHYFAPNNFLDQDRDSLRFEVLDGNGNLLNSKWYGYYYQGNPNVLFGPSDLQPVVNMSGYLRVPINIQN